MRVLADFVELLDSQQLLYAIASWGGPGEMRRAIDLGVKANTRYRKKDPRDGAPMPVTIRYYAQSYNVGETRFLAFAELTPDTGLVVAFLAPRDTNLGAIGFIPLNHSPMECSSLAECPMSQLDCECEWDEDEEVDITCEACNGQSDCDCDICHYGFGWCRRHSTIHNV